MVVIYSNHYTVEEVRGLTEFFQTDLGSKYINTSPVIAGETLSVGRELAILLNAFVTKEVIQKDCEKQKD